MVKWWAQSNLLDFAVFFGKTAENSWIKYKCEVTGEYVEHFVEEDVVFRDMEERVKIGNCEKLEIVEKTAFSPPVVDRSLSVLLRPR